MIHFFIDASLKVPLNWTEFLDWFTEYSTLTTQITRPWCQIIYVISQS